MRIQIPLGNSFEIVGHRPGQPVRSNGANDAAAPALINYLPIKLRRVARPAWANERNFRPAAASESSSAASAASTTTAVPASAARVAVADTAVQATVPALATAVGATPNLATAATAVVPTSADAAATTVAALAQAADTIVAATHSANVARAAAEPLSPELRALAEWVVSGPPAERVERINVATRFAACWTTGNAAEIGIHGMQNLTSLPPIPPSVTKLEVLGCNGLLTPPVITEGSQLKEMSFMACSSLRVAPDPSQCTQLKSYTLQDCDEITVPPDLSGCRQMLDLGFSGCRNLAALPNIAECPELKSLNLSDCHAVPSALNLSMCPHMTALDLSGCTRINALEISGCPNLDSMFLSDCPSLGALPSVGHLRNLDYLNLSNTPLTSLPDDIVSLPQNCTVRLDASRLSDAVRNRLEHIMNAPGYEGPRINYAMGDASANAVARPLDQEVAAWRAEAPEHLQQALTGFDWSTLPQHDNTKAFSTFLARVRETSDYRHPTPELKTATQQRVAKLLIALQSDPTLREECANLALDAVNTCGDRIALRLMDMENLAISRAASADIDAGKYDNNPRALIDLCKGQHRLALVTKEADSKVARMHFTDAIEVHLGYLTKLAGPCQLPVQISTMLYPAFANVTEEDLAAVRKKLSNTGLSDAECAANDQAYQKALAGSPLMRKLLTRLRPADMSAANGANNATLIQAQNRLHAQQLALDPNATDYDQQNRRLMAAYHALEADIPVKATLPLLHDFMVVHGIDSGLNDPVSQQ